jgi:plastocyanin
MKHLTFVGTLAVCAAFVNAVDYQVATGLQGANGAIYAPDSLQVKPGDTISFILIGVIPIYTAEIDS